MIPDWMRTTEDWEPSRHDGGRFAHKTQIRLLALLRNLQQQDEDTVQFSGNPVWRLFVIFFLMILLSLSQKSTFLILAGAVLLIRTAFLSGEMLRRIYRKVLAAAVFALLITMPGILWGNYATVFAVAIKTAEIVLLAAVTRERLRWSVFLDALHRMHLPDLLVFTLDMTVRYLVILGRICQEMLLALRLRMIGTATDNKMALGGVLGTTFLKSRTMADETYEAMQCRGFEGTYPDSRQAYGWHWQDGLLLGAATVAMFGFLYL